MLDWILGITILFFMFFGLYKGLVREVFGFLSLLLGLYFAFQYMGELSGIIISIFSDIPAWLLPPLSFAIIFSGLLILGRILSNILTKILSWVMLGWANRIGGALIGLFKGLILASIFALILGFFATPISALNKAINNSYIYPIVLNVAPFTYDLLTKILPEGEKTFDELKDNVPDFEIPDALDQLKYLQELEKLTSSDADSI